MMRFERQHNSYFSTMGMTAYLAKAAPWQFLVIEDHGAWTASYRLIDPKTTVSASSTIMGPFDDFADAARAAEIKLVELRRLA